MRKRCGLMLACVALVGLIVLSATPVEGRPRVAQKGQTKPKAGGAKKGGAVKLLQTARELAHKAPHEYNGHRKKALVHIDHAIKHLNEASGSTTGPKTKGKGKGKKKGKKKGKGGGNQGNNSQMAVAQMDHAIKQLQEGVKYFEAHHPDAGKGGKGGLSQALKLVTKARQVALKK